MIKCRRGPTIGAVAYGTVVIEIIGDMIRVGYPVEICLMAGIAVSRRILIPIGMAGDTGKWDMRTCQWE